MSENTRAWPPWGGSRRGLSWAPSLSSLSPQSRECTPDCSLVGRGQLLRQLCPRHLLSRIMGTHAELSCSTLSPRGAQRLGPLCLWTLHESRLGTQQVLSKCLSAALPGLLA